MASEIEQLKFLSTVPQHVRDFYHSRSMGWEERSPRCVEAIKRLLIDERMREPWEKLGRNFNAGGYFSYDAAKWGQYFFWAAICRFDRAIAPDPWDSLTHREQIAWQGKLDRIVSEFLGHIEVAPLPPGSLDFRLSADAKKELLGQLGLAPLKPTFHREPRQLSLQFGNQGAMNTYRPYDPHGDARRRRDRGDPITASEVQRAISVCGWTIVDALLDFQKSQKVAEDFPQELAKPRDQKADRARFIMALTGDCEQHYGQPMQELVATCSEVMFDDPSITIRLVRRITTGR